MACWLASAKRWCAAAPTPGCTTALGATVEGVGRCGAANERQTTLSALNCIPARDRQSLRRRHGSNCVSDLPTGKQLQRTRSIFGAMRGDLWTTTTTCRVFPTTLITRCVFRRPLKLRPLGRSAREDGAGCPHTGVALARMRTLNISEQLLASELESKQRTKTFETGLLLAHHGAKVDTILRLVPTPAPTANRLPKNRQSVVARVMSARR